MWPWVLVVLVSVIGTSAENERRVVCYYKSDNIYRAEGYRMQPQEVDPEICTHVIYYSAYLHPHEGVVPSDPYFDLTKGGYKKIVKLKEVNPKLKIMLSIRGDPEERDIWPLITAQKSSRSWFSALVVEYLRAHRFDGLDIDWQIHSSKKNSDNYLLLLKELRHHMELDSLEYNLPMLELSVILPAQIQQLHRHFLLANVSLHVDFINVATMDYWSLDPYTVQHHAPLYKNATEGSLSPLNVDESIKYYLFKCVPPEKLVLGIPTYGRSFKLANDKLYGLGSHCKYPGEKGFATNSPGTLAYFEICTYINEDCWSVGNKKATSLGPYAHHDYRWVGYDDVRIISIKAKYARDKGLGGLMFWTIDQDDFRGYCQHKFPLIRAGKFTLNTGIVVNDAQSLKEEEDRWKSRDEPGYAYPKPTIQQPDFTVHEVTLSTTPMPPAVTTATTVPTTQKTTDNSVLFMNNNTTSMANKPTSEKPTTTMKPTSTMRPLTVMDPSTNSVTAKPVMATTNTVPTSTPKPEVSSNPSLLDERNNSPNSGAQIPQMNLFTPNMAPQNNEESDPSPNDAILHLNRVINTVNQVISNANRINSASSNKTSIPSNITIDPSVLLILQTLLNNRNTAQFTINNSEPSKPTNTTVRVDSEINRFQGKNDLIGSPNTQAFVPVSNQLNPSRKEFNTSIPYSLLTDKSFLISGRDIVNINLNVTVNNNYYGIN